MNALQRIGAVASMIFTAVSMLTMWVFSAASLANNTSEASLREVKLWVLYFSVLSLAGIGVGIWLLYLHRPGRATIVSLLPAIVMGGTLVHFLVRP
jgi:hypothetical protein